MGSALKKDDQATDMDISIFNPEVIEEIKKHKWIESEKQHHDIGNNKAALDWIEKYYDSWLKWKLSRGK
jgi:hypothetical protein